LSWINWAGLGGNSFEVVRYEVVDRLGIDQDMPRRWKIIGPRERSNILAQNLLRSAPELSPQRLCLAIWFWNDVAVFVPPCADDDAITIDRPKEIQLYMQ